MNAQEKVATLEALLARVQKNAALPRPARRTDDVAAPPAAAPVVGISVKPPTEEKRPTELTVDFRSPGKVVEKPPVVADDVLDNLEQPFNVETKPAVAKEEPKPAAPKIPTSPKVPVAAAKPAEKPPIADKPIAEKATGGALPKITPAVPEKTTGTALPKITPAVPEKTTGTALPKITPAVPEKTTGTALPKITPAVPEKTTGTALPKITPTVPEKTTGTARPLITPAVPEKTTGTARPLITPAVDKPAAPVKAAAKEVSPEPPKVATAARVERKTPVVPPRIEDEAESDEVTDEETKVVPMQQLVEQERALSVVDETTTDEDTRVLAAAMLKSEKELGKSPAPPKVEPKAPIRPRVPETTAKAAPESKGSPEIEVKPLPETKIISKAPSVTAAKPAPEPSPLTPPVSDKKPRPVDDGDETNFMGVGVEVASAVDKPAPKPPPPKPTEGRASAPLLPTPVIDVKGSDEVAIALDDDAKEPEVKLPVLDEPKAVEIPSIVVAPVITEVAPEPEPIKPVTPEPPVISTPPITPPPSNDVSKWGAPATQDEPPPAKKFPVWLLGVAAAALLGSAVFVGLQKGWFGGANTAPTTPPVPTPIVTSPTGTGTEAHPPASMSAAPPEVPSGQPSVSASAAVEPAPSGSAAAPPASGSAAAPPASGSAVAPPASASTPPVAGGPDGDGSALPADQGYVIVNSTKRGSVYLFSQFMGVTGQKIQIGCGAKYLRLGEPPAAGADKPAQLKWISEGKSVMVGCKSITTVTIEPSFP